MPTTDFSWRPTNAPIASSRTDDIWFLDPLVGWAVNSNGQILKTGDGGDSWTEQRKLDDVYLRCVAFADASHGWVGSLTDGQRLFQTADGGTTWNAVPLPSLVPSAICGLSVVNRQIVYGSGTNYPTREAGMIKTGDGGTTWTAWSMRQYAHLLVDTLFTSPTRGWVVGGRADSLPATRANVKPVVLYTEDGGHSWVDRAAAIRDQLPRGKWGWKIHFLSDLIGFVALENFTAGAILKTTDGGRTWTRKVVNDPQQNANLEGIGFVDDQHGWVGGWGSADFSTGFTSETRDGGSTWKNANEVGRFINRFRFLGKPLVVGYASGRTVYKYAPTTSPLSAPVAPAPQELKFLASNEPVEADRELVLPIDVPSGARQLRIDIWDRFGEHVRRLADARLPKSGSHIVRWDFTGDYGQRLDAMSFICRVTIDDTSESVIIHRRRDEP